MKKRFVFVALVLVGVLALALSGCGQPKLGTEKNPIVMSFVPSGDTQEIIASGDQIADMMDRVLANAGFAKEDDLLAAIGFGIHFAMTESVTSLAMMTILSFVLGVVAALVGVALIGVALPPLGDLLPQVLFWLMAALAALGK